ncbi:hypothetical protein [Nocardioides sp. AE5]|uniref:hypothetical protein n=1 Tax=Nocardioides sp. AE5 TaxID=2962573 RepID=UPI0028826405|nr:hypothetical protein [Nocardioides sp. AE5]MDT0201186.1 hypothetical protein [Nocardioides sp. AE5]
MVAFTSSTRRSACAVFVVLFGIFGLTAHASSLDVASADFAAWQVATAGERTFVGDRWPGLDEHPIRHIWIVDNASGDEAIGRSSGVIAASIPAYWLTQPDNLVHWPANLTAAGLSAVAITLFYLLLLPRLGQKNAMVGAAVLGLTTPVWSVAADGMWPHTLTVLGIIGMAWAADRERWWLVGFFGGVALWGRLHVALICAVLGIAVALARKSPIIAVKVGAASSAMLALSCVWTRWFYGTWDPTAGYRVGDFGDYASSNRFDVLNHLGFWLAPDRGLLVWTPIILVLAPSLIRGWRELPDWSRHLLLGGLAYLVLQGAMNRYSGGSSFFPYRLQLETLAAAAPALAFSAVRMTAVTKRMFADVAILQGGVIAAGAVGLLVMGEVNGDRNELLLQATTLAFLVVVSFLAWRLAQFVVRREAALVPRTEGEG